MCVQCVIVCVCVMVSVWECARVIGCMCDGLCVCFCVCVQAVVVSYNEDVEVGRCVSRMVDLQCTWAWQVRLVGLSQVNQPY